LARIHPNLKTSVDRLPQRISFRFKVAFFHIYDSSNGENATGWIARFLGRMAALLLLAME
jgi:hypothetical protein